MTLKPPNLDDRDFKQLLDEAQRIISNPFPEEKRQAAFLNAEKSNADSHIDLLYQLWA